MSVSLVSFLSVSVWTKCGIKRKNPSISSSIGINGCVYTRRYGAIEMCYGAIEMHYGAIASTGKNGDTVTTLL